MKWYTSFMVWWFLLTMTSVLTAWSASPTAMCYYIDKPAQTVNHAHTTKRTDHIYNIIIASELWWFILQTITNLSGISLFSWEITLRQGGKKLPILLHSQHWRPTIKSIRRYTYVLCLRYTVIDVTTDFKQSYFETNEKQCKYKCHFATYLMRQSWIASSVRSTLTHCLSTNNAYSEETPSFFIRHQILYGWTK